MIVSNQLQKLPVVNFDTNIEIKRINKHGSLLGDCKRSLIVGPSGCGKTNALISLLTHPNGLRFTNIYLYSKTLFQPKYAYLRAVLAPLKYIGYYEYENSNDIIHPRDVKDFSVIVFDDVICSEQSPIREHFSYGRHKKIDCFYLCQTYSSISRQLIRDNSNFILVFRQNNQNLKHIFDDHINDGEMTFQTFKNICSQCWKEPFGFLCINKDETKNSGRYRQGFDRFIQVP